MIKRINNFFDKLEDVVRSKLSQLPFLYAFLAGIGVVLFWRGVWHTADYAFAILIGTESITIAGLLDGPASLIIGSLLLLITGVFVSAFIGNRLIISGLKGEKKIVEKTKDEIISEENKISEIQKTLERVEKKIESLDLETNNKN